MRNRFGGRCYRCGQWVAAGDGHFEKFQGRFRVQHASCAIAHRGTPDPERVAHTLRKLEQRAQTTGRLAQKARKRLKEMHNAD